MNIIAVLVAGYAGGYLVRRILDKGQAEWVANNLAKGSSKPTINIGAGCGKPFSSSGWGDIRCDIKPTGECIYCDITELSQFNDKEFSVALVSHVLEHLDNPETALKEVQRIADNVVVVLPPASSISAWLVPQHKWVIVGNQPVKNYSLLNWTLLGLATLFAFGYYKGHGKR